MKLILLALLGLVNVSAVAIQKKSVEDRVVLALKNRVIPIEAQQLTGEQLARYVNANQAYFKASTSQSVTLESVQKRLMRVEYLKASDEVADELIIAADVPTSFDARTHWTQCPSLNNIRDQSDCGSCWAFGAAEAMSDRLCIATNGKTQVTLSADDLLSCCGKMCGNGCQGGYPIEAWRYWVKKGVCSGGSYESQAGCKPYPFAPCGHHKNETFFGDCPTKEYPTPTCFNDCKAGYAVSYDDDKHYGKSAYGVQKAVIAIQKEILTYGPVEAAFTVYEDFYQYTGGIYVHTGGKKLGGHAVKIIGWGVESGTPYWLVANSWNTDWGEQGFFRIVRGVDECDIEGAIVAGLPK